MHRRVLPSPHRALALLVAVAVACGTTLWMQRAHAVVTTPFAEVFAADANGAIVLRGNASLTCRTSDAGCPQALAGTATGGTEVLNNNGYVMVDRDVDADPATFNSSRTALSLPADSTVLFAGLYWSANMTAGTGGGAPADVAARGGVLFDTPAAGGYAPVAAGRVMETGGVAYQGYANVTAAVAAGGNGTYTVGNIQAGTGKDRYAGWALVIAYRNPAESMRDLRVYDGFGAVSSGSTSVDIPLSGFRTPQSGPVVTRIGTVVYEGDLGKTGDSLQLNGLAETDGRNPADNFFNSTVSDAGAAVTDRDPAYPNLLGVDVDQFDASGQLANDATSATLRLTTGGETFYPGVVTFATDLYAPNLEPEMTATDIDGGTLLPGDILEYRVRTVNTGTDGALESVLTDAVPTGTTYVPGSLRVDGAPVSDAAGDDTGTFTPDAQQGSARFHLGTGATAAAGGAFAPESQATYAVTVRFRVRVDLSTPAGTVLRNAAQLTYTGADTGRHLAGVSATSAVTVAAPDADLAAAVSVAPDEVQRAAAPAAVTYTVTVANRGPQLEPAAGVTLHLPAGVTAGAPPAGCTVAGADVTCAAGSLAAGTDATFTVPATAAAGAPSRAHAVATAAGTGHDPQAGNDGADAVLVVNTAPTAGDDTADTVGGRPVRVPVLGGDADLDGDTLTVAVTVPPAVGTAVPNADGTVTYTPPAAYAGPASFTYTVDDGHGGTATARVDVDVADAPPAAVGDVAATGPGQLVRVPVLVNDGDPGGGPLTVTGVGTSPDGTAGFTATEVSFTPAAGFAGTAHVTYEITDAAGNTATATLAVTVANAAPVAADDEVTGWPYGADGPVDVLGNDADGNGDALHVSAVTQPDRGRVELSGGTVTYRAPAGFSGRAAFTYEVTDARGDSATATVTVTVDNAAPTLAGFTQPVASGTATEVDVPAHAHDPDGDPLTVAGVTAPAHGTLSTGTGGALVYTPDPGYAGPDAFDVTVSDGDGGTATATVSVTVANGVPTAGADAVTVEMNAGGPVAVLLDDADPNGDPLTVTVDGAPGHGTAVVDGDGTVVYTPAPGWTGTDTFHYTVDDGRGGTAGASVTVVVVDSPPAVADTSAGTDTDAPVVLDPRAAVTEPNGDEVTLDGWTGGAHGTVAVQDDGTLLYTPDAGWSGTDVFTYTVRDPAGQAATATVTVTVRNAAPVAAADALRAQPGATTVLDVLGNDVDPNTGQRLRVRSVTTPVHGIAVVGADGRVRYTPAAGSRTDTFAYTVGDDEGATDTAVVTVTVDAAPLAAADTASTGTGTPVTVAVLGNDTDPEGGPLTVAAAGPAGHGTVRVGTDGTVTYTPAAGWWGVDGFDYTAVDGPGGRAVARVTVTVRNAAPAARDDVAAVAAGGRAEVAVLANDTDPNTGQALRVTRAGRPGHGTAAPTADGRIRYVPDAGYAGPDAFTYRVEDGHGGAATATVRVTVTAVAPVALPERTRTPYGRPVTVPVLGNDVDPQRGRLTVVAVTQPGHGRVTFTGTAVRYVPPAGFAGAVDFTYTVADPDGRTATATVTVTVAAPPAVPDRSAATEPGAPVTVRLPARDAHHRPVTVVAVGTPGHGTARLSADGRVVYTAAAGFTGTDRFTYTARDADGATATATVTVQVAGAPTAAADRGRVRAGDSVRLAVLGNDGGGLTLLRVGAAAHGTATANADGTITYRPQDGYAGTDRFGYTVRDARGRVATATVTVAVEAGPRRLATTGTDTASVVGAGVLTLLVGVILLAVSRRSPAVAGAPAGWRGRHRPGRHRPGR